MSFNIYSRNKDLLAPAESLADALEKAKAYNEFVIITDGTIEIGGVFGVAAVKDGKTPDGQDYTWNKSDRIGKMRKKDQQVAEDTSNDEDWDD